jgi:hypothetical protein
MCLDHDSDIETVPLSVPVAEGSPMHQQSRKKQCITIKDDKEESCGIASMDKDEYSNIEVNNEDNESEIKTAPLSVAAAEGSPEPQEATHCHQGQCVTL